MRSPNVIPFTVPGVPIGLMCGGTRTRRNACGLRALPADRHREAQPVGFAGAGSADVPSEPGGC